MPYAIQGNAVVKKSTGEVVGHSKNPKKYLRTLNAVEHGWTPDQHKMARAMGVELLKKPKEKIIPKQYPRKFKKYPERKLK